MSTDHRIASSATTARSTAVTSTVSSPRNGFSTVSLQLPLAQWIRGTPELAGEVDAEEGRGDTTRKAMTPIDNRQSASVTSATANCTLDVEHSDPNSQHNSRPRRREAATAGATAKSDHTVYGNHWREGNVVPPPPPPHGRIAN